MDASFALTGLIEEFTQSLDQGDFEGAEEILSGALSTLPSQYEAFVHFQMGRLYNRWNKLTSSLNHLSLAAELAHKSQDQLFLLQVREELKAVKNAQTFQRP